MKIARWFSALLCLLSTPVYSIYHAREAPVGAMLAKQVAQECLGTFLPDLRPSAIDEAPLFPFASLYPADAENCAIGLHSSFILIVPYGRLCGKNGAVIAPNEYVVAETSVQWSFFLDKDNILDYPELPPLRFTQEKVAVIATKNPYSYYHWMFDVLPRYELLRSSGIPYDKLCIHSNDLPFQEETLKVLQIDPSQIIRTDREFHLQADEVIVPSYPAKPGFIPAWSCDFLRRTFLPPDLLQRPPMPTRKIFISREHAATRRIINEEELWRKLSTQGFEKVALETLTVAEQAKLFFSSSVIVAQHGAGLTNLVFCQPGTKVLEIFTPSWVNPCYWRLSHVLRLDHRCMMGDPVEGTLDIKVDCDTELWK